MTKEQKLELKNLIQEGLKERYEEYKEINTEWLNKPLDLQEESV